jgi:NADH-quinone oxidoreductase subunit N
MVELYDFKVLIPEFTLAILAMLSLLWGAFAKPADAFRQVFVLAMISLAVAFYAVIQVHVLHNAVRPDYVGFAFNNLFRVDAFATVAKCLILVAAGFSMILVPRFFAQNDGARFEVFVLIQLSVLGMMCMVSANNFITLYAALELQSLALYVLTTMQSQSSRATEAGLKYFVLGALSSGLLLFGISLVYGTTGHIDFISVATILTGQDWQQNLGLLTGLVLIVIGLAFKVSAVPFHMWTPDVYEGAPTPITAFLSVAPKMAAMALIVRVLGTPFGSHPEMWQQIIVVLAGASMLLGSFAALRQTNIKRLMAYSSIGHMGFILMGLAAATPEGVRSLVAYMGIYLVMSVAAFAGILAMQRRGQNVEAIGDLAGLGKTQPVMAAAWLVVLFSMAGIPPLAGFFAKLYVILAAVKAGLIPLAVIAVLSSVVAAYYYLNIIKIMYFDSQDDALDRHPPLEYRYLLVGGAAVLALFLVLPDWWLNWSAHAAGILYGTSPIGL